MPGVLHGQQEVRAWEAVQHEQQQQQQVCCCWLLHPATEGVAMVSNRAEQANVMKQLLSGPCVSSYLI